MEKELSIPNAGRQKKKNQKERKKKRNGVNVRHLYQ